MTSTLAPAQPSTASSISALARPEVRGLPAYNAGLSSAAVRARYGVAHIARLGSNENPYGASPAVAQALAGLAAQAGTYPDANAGALREGIARWTGAPAERIVVGNGSENLLEVLCQVFLTPGDRVVTLLPSFGLHEIYPRMMGAQVTMVPVTSALEFDVDAWCAALAGGAKLVFLANPSNPVGCMLDTAAFRRIVAAAPEDAVLVVDEAYVEYALHSPGFPDAVAELSAQPRPWIVLRTFSKAWGLAGLRVGYGIASSAEFAGLLHRVRTPFNVNMAAQMAALAALSDPAHMQASVARTVAAREVLVRQLRGLDVAGLRIAPSATNFLFIDLGRPNAPVHEALLARGVITKAWKERGFENYLRVSVGTAEDNQRFVDALAEILG
ncbi:histidinol-phosphate transaminase [Rhodoferax koreense]|uniref:Histidinol-phosphate aminotransferase n=1 Tax=Rhodoferax koreensis TaxID=1842727 RepID=A0A1P8JRT4_9BURK|nr:histidinol-phosphate transaminase [Rhodoferax koreense]APW36473.1 histidinol-phosphate transaminase [Rhodoferax koreense]